VVEMLVKFLASDIYLLTYWKDRIRCDYTHYGR